jgi:hypothetical protein
MAAPLHVPVESSALTPPTDRLSLKPVRSTSGYVDGAWWPASDDLAAELPALSAQLSDRWGTVHRVSYDMAAWAPAPRQLIVNGRRVRLDGFRGRRPGDVIHIQSSGTEAAALTLLVVSATEERAHAQDILRRAGTTGNLDTIDALLDRRE